jgi:hypothetical protein
MDLCDALDLDRRLPNVAVALEEGTIDPRRVRTLLRGTSHLTIAGARTVFEAVLDETPELTTGQLTSRLRTLSIEVDPQAAARYELGVSQRCVVAEAETDGTATLHAPDLPPDRLAAGMAHINHLARSLHRSGETRTMDQLRADVLLDLLEGTRVTTRATRGPCT